MFTFLKIRSPSSYSYFMLSALIVVLIPIASACTQNVPTPLPAFPTQHVVQTQYPTPTLLVGSERLTALAVGRMIYEEGCLILVEDFNTQETLVWPVGMRVDVNQDEATVTIFNPDGSTIRVVLREQMVRVGGGPAPEGFPQVQPFVNTAKYTGINDCPPPYWIVASVKPYATPTPSGE